MITPEKMEEWIHEIEERPSSALIIVQYIANRLRDLTRRNEELRVENIQLRSEKKVEEFETRITSLEYQLDLLKRQLGGEPVETAAASAAVPAETLSFLVYNAQGEVLRVECPAAELTSRQVVARIAATQAGGSSAFAWGSGEIKAPTQPPRLLVTASFEELLFLFDSGRIVTLPVANLPLASGALDWKQAYLAEPRGIEELAAIVPVGRMALADSIVQCSRRGSLKKMMRPAFEGYLAKYYVGTGTKLNTDRTFDLTLCAKGDRYVLVSQEGYLQAFDTERLSYAIEETMRLSTTDHIIANIALGQRKTLVFVSHSGKVLQREIGWLEPAASSRSRGQSVLSDERRKKGIRVVGAAAVEEDSWCAVLDQSGSLVIHPFSELFGAGTVFSEQPAGEVQAFAAFSKKEAA